MGISFYRFFALVSFVVNAAAQFSQVTQSVPGQPPGYVAGAATSRVAAPAFTPTLVYNCYYMPLICENVASYAKSINPNGGGDLAGPQLFHFDPDKSSKNARREATCGCFNRDGCDNAESNGKSNGAKVTDIAKQAPFDTLNTPISQADINIILAGFNAETRVPFPSVPGRFLGVSGVAFSCDEFPAATFIEGGIGINGNGNRAKTICAMQSWQIYRAATASSNSPGKWPFIGSGQKREQDWQGSSHASLRNAFNIRSSQGLGTVYPFSFTTTTLSPQEQTKAYVIGAAAVTMSVMRRDGTLTTSTYSTTTTVGVFDDETSEPRRRFYDAEESSQHGNGEEKIGSAVPRLRVRQALEPAQTFTSRPTSTVGSNQTSSLTTAPGFSSGSAMFPLANGSISTSLMNSATSSLTPSTLYTVQPSPNNGSDSRTNTGSSFFSVGFPSATPSASSAINSSLTETLRSATSLTIQKPTVGTNSSASGSSVVDSGATKTFGIGASASGLANNASLVNSTTNGNSSTSFPKTSSGVSATSNTQSSGAIVAGSPIATFSASAVSSNVASASSAAAALAADPSNKQKAQIAQNQTHNAKDAATAMLSLAVAGSPLASALFSLVGSLGIAAAAADAVVDESTAAAVADLLSDLGDAANDAEGVREESEDDDDEPSQSQISQTMQTTPSSQTNPSSITSSASFTVSSSGSIMSPTSSQSNSSVATQTSASAAPSQCTLSFDVDGDEDIEVGDDYDGLDEYSSDVGVCNPIYGPGGSIIPCSASESGANTSISATGASNSTQSGTASSAYPTGFITSSIGPNITIGGSATTSNPSLQPSTPISTAPLKPPAISFTTLPPSLPPLPSSPSLSPPPPSTTPTPPTPSQTSSNAKGSFLCKFIGGTTCKTAYSQYNDTYLYTAYTSYVLSSGEDSIVNDLFPVYANDGCTAIFECDSATDYAVGMTGAQIKAAFDYLFEYDSVGTCGSSYLSNGCHVTVNGCDDCKAVVPCGSLDAANIANKFPCYS